MYRAIFVLILSISICACGQETYTTWSCKDGTGSTVPMILKKAQMQFQGLEYDYCGSLGPQSYFELKCTVQIQNASNVFTTDTGKLISNGKEFQCNAL